MASSLPEFDAALRENLARWNLRISRNQMDHMRRHYLMMVEANRSFNLTRITAPVEAAVKHFADSLALIAWQERRGIDIRNALDVGTGAGFPAVPIAIARPDWTVTAIDGTRKKIDFVQRVASDIALTNLRCVHAHSDHWKTDARFELVTVRALAAWPVALAATQRFLTTVGRLVVYGTADQTPDKSEATGDAAIRNGLEVCDYFSYELTCGEEEIKRRLLVCRPA